MPQLCFFLLFISIFTHTAEINDNFIVMKQHIENCPINCTSPECAQKDKTILDERSKAVYKGVYCTYHCLTEFDGQRYGLDQDFCFFVNYYGEVLICKKDASTKKDLLLFKRCTDFERHDKEDLGRKLRSILCWKKTKGLDALAVPDFRFARSIDHDGNSDYLYQRLFCWCKPSCSRSDTDYDRPASVNLDIDFLCCANDTPLDVVNRICNMMFAIKPRTTYLYSFFDTTGADSSCTDGKKYLFSLVDVTHLTTAFNHWQRELLENVEKDSKLHFATADYRYFLVDHKFTITDLYTDIDLFSNGGKRIAMVCEQEECIKYWLSSEIKKSHMLMHIPRRREERDCAESRRREDWFRVKLYTIAQIKKNHEAFEKGAVGDFADRLPLNCYHAQIISGPEQEIRGYLAVALKRIALRTLCLAKNDAASENCCEVYNNPFGEFVVMRKGKATVLNASLTCGDLSCERYYAVHSNDAVWDDIKMLERAQQYAQVWKKTSDGRFLYYWEENPQGTCTKVYPYGVECDWSGARCGDTRYEGFCSLYQRQDKEDIEFRGAGLESFGRYRLWIMPMQAHVDDGQNQKRHDNGLCESFYRETDLSCFESKKSSDLSLYVAYADWPYEVTQVAGDVLVFDHEQSDFRLTLEIPAIKQKYWVSRFFPGEARIYPYLAEVVFDNKQSDVADRGNCKVVHLVRIRYTYKDTAKRAQFDQHQQQRVEQKLRDEQAKKDAAAFELQRRMGFCAQGNSQLQRSHYPKMASQFITLLQNNTLKIFGGLTFGAVVAGAMWYLHKHRALEFKLQVPNKTT